jgi:hypothetical protein
MKKVLCVLLLAVSLTAAVSAQASGAKMSVSLDTMPLFKGFIWADSDAKNSLFALSPSFEYRVAPHFSIGGTLDLWFGKAFDFDIFYLGIIGQGRWYPLSTGIDKLFLEAAIGFNRFAVEGEADAEDGGFTGLITGLKAGWKILFGSTFFVEPSMAYVYSKVNGADVPTPLGWQAGLRIGAAF